VYAGISNMSPISEFDDEHYSSSDDEKDRRSNDAQTSSSDEPEAESRADEFVTTLNPLLGQSLYQYFRLNRSLKWPQYLQRSMKRQVT
jgi:hypothetical protein